MALSDLVRGKHSLGRLVHRSMLARDQRLEDQEIDVYLMMYYPFFDDDGEYIDSTAHASSTPRKNVSGRSWMQCDPSEAVWTLQQDQRRHQG